MQQPTLPASHSGLLQGKSLHPALAPARTPPAPRFPGPTGREHYPPCGKEGQSSAAFTVVNAIKVRSTTLKTLFSRKKRYTSEYLTSTTRGAGERTGHCHQTDHCVLSPTGRKLVPLTNPSNSLQAAEHLSLLLPVSGAYRAGETEVRFPLPSLPSAS